MSEDFLASHCFWSVGLARLRRPTTDLVSAKCGACLDAKNNLSAGAADLAIKDGKIAAVAPHIATQRRARLLIVSGFYVTPGLVDIHVHAYADRN